MSGKQKLADEASTEDDVLEGAMDEEEDDGPAAVEDTVEDEVRALLLVR